MLSNVMHHVTSTAPSLRTDRGNGSKLMEYANQSIFRNHVVSAQQVPKQQVNPAQLLNKLAMLPGAGQDARLLSNKLLSPFRTMLRKMGKVSHHLVPQIPRTTDDLQLLLNQLSTNRDNRDVMRNQVELNQPKPDANSSECDSPLFGQSPDMPVGPVINDRVLTPIKRIMGDDEATFAVVFSTQHTSNQLIYTKYMAATKTRLLLHVSHSGNWLLIPESGSVFPRPAQSLPEK